MTEPTNEPRTEAEAEAEPDPATQPLLHCLDGNPAPAEMGPALCRWLEMPEAVVAKLGELLLPNLGPLAEDQLDNRIARLCRRSELDPEQVGPGIKATVALFRQAAMFALEDDELQQDIRALGGGQVLVDLLVPLYRQVFPDLRSEYAMASIVAHGKVLTGVEWRMDTIGSSSRGRKLNVPVALVTLSYQAGQKTEQITLQMVADSVAGLRQVCDHLLNR